MKLLFLLLTFLIIHDNNACEYVNNRALRNLGDNYGYVKSYRISRGRGSVEYTAVFSKKTFYQLSLAEAKYTDAPQLKVTIRDSKKRIITSNETHDKFIQKLNFRISKTGIYYLQFEFTEEDHACGAAVLGFYQFKFKPNQQYELLVEITDEKEQKNLRILYGETNKDLQLKILFCYRKEEWYEVIDVEDKSYQSLEKYYPPRIPKSHPKLEFWIKEIDPYP